MADNNQERPEKAPSNTPNETPPARTTLSPGVELTIIHSPQFHELAAALATAQLHIDPAPKNAENPHFKRPYSDMASVREAFRKPLAENGIAFTQIPSTDSRGTLMKLTTLLIHKSGQYLGGEIIFTAQSNAPQATGSMLTYMRRYAAMAIVGIASSDDDDDAEGAQGRGPNGPPQQPPPRQSQGQGRREEPRGRGDDSRGRDDRPRDDRPAERPPQDRPRPAAAPPSEEQSPPRAAQGAPQGAPPAGEAKTTAKPATPPGQGAAPATGEKGPPYPASLTGDARVHYDGLIARVKEAKTKMDLGAMALDIAKLPYAEGSPEYTYIHWVFDWMSHRLEKAPKR